MVGNDRSDGTGMHCLVKTELHVSESGKKYHKSSNCVIYIRRNVRRQTTFICSQCNVDLYCLSFTERTKVPTECFKKYHKKIWYFSSSSSDKDDMLSCDSINDFVFLK